MSQPAPNPASRSSVAYWCAAVALLVGALGAGFEMKAEGWEPSALIQMSGAEPMAQLARRIDPSFRFVDPDAHYDGVYFYAVALDPLARGEAHALIDQSVYRYGHAGYGWLAWLGSAGRAKAVPWALLFVGLAGLALAAWAVTRLIEDQGRSGWWGLAVALNPGLIYALTAVCSETAGAAAIAMSLLFWTRGRYLAAAPWLVLACVIKEPFVLVPVGLAAWEGITWIRGRRAHKLLQRAAVLAAGPLVFSVWYVYLRVHFGQWPHEATPEGFFYFPFVGWAKSVGDAAGLANRSFYESQIGAASGPLIAAFIGACVVGAAWAVRLRSALDPVYLLFALLITTLGPLGLVYPKDMIRLTAIPLMLLPPMLAASMRARDALNVATASEPEAIPARGALRGRARASLRERTRL
ncbi:MAG: hypothetical protein M3292_03330 [Actinomycetota bacterium]|nr:hypothetical protein [Actinomycetota bacterium]